MNAMRSCALAAALAVAAPAAAAPIDDSRQLYDAVLAAAASFIEITAQEMPAAAMAAALTETVSRPVSAADTAWMARMVEGGPDAYLPFFPCRQAAVALEGIASEFSGFLRGQIDRPDVEDDARYFRDDLAGCEAALGVAASSIDLADGVGE